MVIFLYNLYIFRPFTVIFFYILYTFLFDHFLYSLYIFVKIFMVIFLYSMYIFVSTFFHIVYTFLMHHLWFCLFVSRFYSPVNPVGSCRAQSVRLSNHPFTGQAKSSKWLTSIVHLLLPENTIYGHFFI